MNLLFYHRGLSCLGCIWIKSGSLAGIYGKNEPVFKALDREVKTNWKSKQWGKSFVLQKDDGGKFALSRSLSPVMVSNYTLNW